MIEHIQDDYDLVFVVVYYYEHVSIDDIMNNNQY